MATRQTTFDSTEVDPHEGEEQCPECNEWFKGLGYHWRYSPDHRPSLGEPQHEIIIGSLFGDGTYNIDGRYFDWRHTINRPYLKWIQRQFGNLVSDISTRPLGDNVSGLQSLGRSTTIEDVGVQFSLITKPHPELSFCREWGYSENGFVSNFPDGVGLTPTILKVWYISDGTVNWSGGEFNSLRISNKTHTTTDGYFTSLFKEIGIDIYVSSGKICIPERQTEAFFDYIGSPPCNRADGFAYKWEYQDRDEYDRLFKTMKEQPYWDRENECLVEDYEPEYTDY